MKKIILLTSLVLGLGLTSPSSYSEEKGQENYQYASHSSGSGYCSIEKVLFASSKGYSFYQYTLFITTFSYGQSYKNVYGNFPTLKEANEQAEYYRSTGKCES